MTLDDHAHHTSPAAGERIRPGRTPGAPLAAAVLLGAVAGAVRGQDLVPTALSPQAVLTAGKSMSFTGRITNTALRTAGASLGALYLSPKAGPRTSQDMLLSRWSTPSLAFARAQSVSGTVRVPIDARHGNPMYLLLVADDTNLVAERNEKNNLRAKQVVVNGYADLYYTGFPLLPRTLTRGQRASDAIMNVINRLYKPAGAFRVSVYLSADKTITPQDRRLASGTLPGLAAGWTKHLRLPLNAPVDIPVGECYLGVWIDDLNAVPEAYEQNNFAVQKITCLGKPIITRQPASRIVPFGASSPPVLLCVAGGATTYQWRKNGVVLTGETAPGLKLTSSLTSSHAGSYDCVVSNKYGTVVSRAAKLTVGPARALKVPTSVSDIVANVGDVDGDGYEDWARGRPFQSSTSSGIYITSGKTQKGLSDARFGGGIRAGQSIAAGDLDGDGKSDVLLGAPGYKSGGIQRGQILYRSSRQNRYYVFVSGTRIGLGRLLATAQLDADGVCDVVTIDSAARDLSAYSGKTRRLLWRVRPFASQNVPIQALAKVGDTNADGYDEVVIGLPTYQSNNGRWELRSGRDGKLLRSFDGQGGARLGHAVAGIGDVTGDRVPDFIVGAPEAFSRRGVGRIFGGAQGKLYSSHFGAAAGDRAGYAVAAAGGDVNGDGVPDVLISQVPTSAARKGVVRAHSGKAPPKILLTSTGPSNVYGTSIAGFDANSDDRPDLLALEYRKNVWLLDGLPKANPPGFTVYGRTCPGTGGRLPRMGLAGRLPRVGRAFTLTLGSGRANSVSILQLGLPARNNIPLDAVGMTGCSLHAGLPVLSFVIPTGGRGGSRMTLPIPDDASLVNARQTWQWFVLDVGANRFNLTASEGAATRIGAK